MIPTLPLYEERLRRWLPAVKLKLTPDGPDVFSGLFNSGVDDIFDNLGSSVVTTLNDASVNVIPEPSTALLLASGLVAIAAGRRRRAL